MIRKCCTILYLALRKFAQIDGTQWAGAFAYYAFFSLFPLLVLFVTVASMFINRDHAVTAVIAYVEPYVPIKGEMQGYIFNAIAGVVKARTQAGAFALLTLIWAAMQFFNTLICATNKAWGNEGNSMWRLPAKSFVFLIVMVGAVMLGIAAPIPATLVNTPFLRANTLSAWLFVQANVFIPLLVVFGSLCLFYKLAPRRPTRYTEVWLAALGTTVILRAAVSLFVVYLTYFAAFNAVYGTFGGIMALLLWIYVTGCILIFGACLCAAQAEQLLGAAQPAEAP